MAVENYVASLIEKTLGMEPTKGQKELFVKVLPEPKAKKKK